MKGRWNWAIVGAVLALPMAVTAQEPMGGMEGMEGMDPEMQERMHTLHLAQAGDFETMRDKFLALADAFPEETWDWSPMEGVRSVRDVMALIVAEGYHFPSSWGVEPPAGAESGFGPEMERVGAMSKSEVIAEMEKSFDHLITTTSNLTHMQHIGDEADWFGRKVSVANAMMLAGGDMHEHLGQSIAYARTNHIVPPWSR